MTTHQNIVVTTESLNGNDETDVAVSNAEFVTELLEEHFHFEELHQDAVRGYLVQKLFSEVSNGGFAQFVYNSEWSDAIVRYINDGLRAIDAKKTQKHFEVCAEVVTAIGAENLAKFLQGDFFGSEEQRQILNSANDGFDRIAREECLSMLLPKWLRRHPQLLAIRMDEWRAVISSITARQDGRNERVEAARSREPDFVKMIRAACKAADIEFQGLTGGVPAYEYEGRSVSAWYFKTNKGNHFSIEINGTLIILRTSDNQKIIEWHF